jgi:hypothetical protein
MNTLNLVLVVGMTTFGSTAHSAEALQSYGRAGGPVAEAYQAYVMEQAKPLSSHRLLRFEPGFGRAGGAIASTTRATSPSERGRIGAGPAVAWLGRDGRPALVTAR